MLKNGNAHKALTNTLPYICQGQKNSDLWAVIMHAVYFCSWTGVSSYWVLSQVWWMTCFWHIEATLGKGWYQIILKWTVKYHCHKDGELCTCICYDLWSKTSKSTTFTAKHQWSATTQESSQLVLPTIPSAVSPAQCYFTKISPTTKSQSEIYSSGGLFFL